MAVGTEEIGSLTADEIARPLPMNACLPIPVEVAMAFPAESVALCELNQLPVEEPEFIPVLCIVAVETPSHGLGVMEPDVRVFLFEFPLLSIDLHGGVAVAAGK
jgi:hypothetical protein